MRKTTSLFAVNGVPLLIPDAEVAVSYEDLDSNDSGRDESGVMHRFMVRAKVASWAFTYSHLTEEEKQYMENLFQDGAVFTFTHPDRVDAAVARSCQAYRSKYAISWKNAKTGLWTNYSFHIIQC